MLYEGNNGYCALVAEVEVNQDTGAVTVKRFVAAQDCGPISNPDGLKNQVEGGIMQGMSRALGEEVTWDATKITSVDWRTYRPVYLGAELPVIESVLINTLGVAGERRRRNRDHHRRRRDRQRDLRCDRRPHPRSAVHARAREGGARGPR